MSNRIYLCANCGIIRRASAVYVDTSRESWAEAKVSARWPKHCGRSMEPLSFVQAEAVTQLKEEERVKWMASGMYVLRHRQRGNRKWKPVLAAWQIEEAKRQKQAYLVKLEEIHLLRRRRKPVRIHKRRQLLGSEEI